MAQRPEDEFKPDYGTTPNANPHAGMPDNIPTPAPPAPPIASPDPMGLMTPTSGPEAAPAPVDPAAAPQKPAGPMGPDFPFPNVTPDPGPMGPENPFPTTEPGEPAPVMGPPEEQAGPMPQTEQEKARDERRANKKQDKERVNNLLMERARARRGLPPIDSEARAAIDSPEAAKAYRQGPAAPAAAQPGQAGQTPAAPGQVPQPGQAPAGPPKGGYQTGQTVQLTGMPGGDTSTQVYSMGGGIALPDGQGMSSQDFMQAFKQINPGKTTTDAIQALSREPGATGNAARKILRDIGASGGAALSPDQQSQVEQALSGRAGELLRGHSRGMAQNISRGATERTNEIKARETKALKDQEEEKKREEALRKQALAAAEARFKEEDNFKSRAQLIEEEYKNAQSARDYIEGGDAAGVDGRDPDRITLDVKQVTRKVDRIPSGQPEVSFNEQGMLEYTAKGLPGKLNAAMVEAEGLEGGKQVVPIIEEDRQVDFLKPGQPYLDSNGQLHMKGTPGRPKGEGGSGGSSGNRKKPDPIGSKPGRPGRVPDEFNLQDISKEMRDAAQKEGEAQLKPLQDQFADAQRNYQQAVQDAKDSGVSNAEEDPQVVIQKRELESSRSAVDDARSRVQERLNITPEMAQEEAKRRIKEQETFAQAERDLRFELGDETVVEERLNSFLPENMERVVTPQGNAMVVGNVTIPTSKDDPNIPDPQTASQIAALERSSRGNIPTARLGTTSSDAVGESGWEEAGAIRDSLAESVAANEGAGALTMVTGTDEEKMALYERVQDYARLKYGDEMSENPEVIEAVFENLGFVDDEDPRADMARNMQRQENENTQFREERTGEHYAAKRSRMDALVEAGIDRERAEEMVNEEFGMPGTGTEQARISERAVKYRERYGTYDRDEVNPYTGKPYAE